jgi:hypothetical protein
MPLLENYAQLRRRCTEFYADIASCRDTFTEAHYMISVREFLAMLATAIY